MIEAGRVLEVPKFSAFLQSDFSMERSLTLICNRYLDTPSSYLSKFSSVDINILRSLLHYLNLIYLPLKTLSLKIFEISN